MNKLRLPLSWSRTIPLYLFASQTSRRMGRVGEGLAQAGGKHPFPLPETHDTLTQAMPPGVWCVRD
jgi:hypothetical protein